MPSEHKLPDTVFKSPRALIESDEVTLPSLYEWHARENPHYPLFRFHDGHRVKNITYSEAFRAVCRAASNVRSRVGTTTDERIVVAILANSDTIAYWCTSMGILHAGHIAFHVSQRNGSAAVADLLRRTNCKHVFVSQDSHISNLVTDAILTIEGIALHPVQTFDELFATRDTFDKVESSQVRTTFGANDTALILHSSGSTNHPKPVNLSHKRSVRYGTVPWYGEVNITGNTISAHGVPMFHTMGVGICCMAACNGAILGVFQPASPPVFPTPDNVFDHAMMTKADYMLTVPAFIEEWSRDVTKVTHMKRMKGLTFGGAPLKQEVGDALAKQGVSLITHYGCTEVGTMANFIPANPGMDWSYFTISPWIKSVQVDAGEGKYEIIVLSFPDCPLNLINTKVGGQDAYATNDLLEPHPTKPGMWRVYGRQDEQIVLSNGEKTNPLPIEHIINEDPHIASCIVFGHGRFQNGVLVLPKPEYSFDPEKGDSLVDFRSVIWPTIERANNFAPQHSRIFKEMILVASTTKPFQYNAKGYPRRAPNLANYEAEIEALYSEIERSAQNDVRAPTVWDVPTIAPFLREVIERVLQHPILDTADLFRSGCDSLQATWIRNTILRAVCEHSPAAAQRLPMNVVFQAPSVAALTHAVLRAVHDDASDAAEVCAEDLVRLAERHSADLPERPANLREREEGKDVVVISGTTGGFGCDVLEHLLRDDEVGLVYAFNRPGSKALERQHARFRERGLDEELLKSPKFRLVEASLDTPGLGIEESLLEEIRTSVTHIMHNAWRVDFNMSLSSFDVDLKGVRNLIELSLSSPLRVPPKLVFVSSVGIFGKCTVQPPVPEVPIDPSSALDTGYSQSKWIAEKTLYNVSEHAGIPVVVVRLGQVCGDRLGHWNEKEWFPVLVKSALFTRCLPDVDGTVSFIPSYPAARAFVEMRNAPSLAVTTSRIFHLVHPREASWRTLITPLASSLRVPLVPYARWLNALEASAGSSSSHTVEVDAMRENPALRLLSFFREQTFAPERDPLGVVKLSTEQAEDASSELARLPALDEEAGRRWIAAWRRSGFVPTG